MALARPMFRSEKVGLYLDDMTHRMQKPKKEGEPEIPMVDLLWRIQPLTAQLTEELLLTMRRTLFRLSDGEAVAHIKAAGFTLGVPRQNLRIYPAPDVKRARFALLRCDVSKVISARTDKDSPGFVLTFRTSYAHPSGEELAYFQGGLYKQHFVDFEPADPTLDFGDSPEPDEDANEIAAQRQAEVDAAPAAGDGQFAGDRTRDVAEMDVVHENAARAATKEPARRLPRRSLHEKTPRPSARRATAR